MKTRPAFFLLIPLALTLAPAGAAVRYVNLANPSPAPPYITWASAATNIQDAIDAANAGDEVVVTNGVYQTGGDGANRVAVTLPVTVRSVNGPDVTVIRGYQVPGMTNGDGAVRCVYLANAAALEGFTLTNGAAAYGGGVLCESASEIVSNCTLTGNSAIYGGGASFGTLNNCVLGGNSAFQGGGVCAGTLNNCTISGNSATIGGGASSVEGPVCECFVPRSTLNNCTLMGNSAVGDGGGAFYGTLNNCIVTGNSAGRGGGAFLGTLSNCTITDNSADEGGGVSGTTAAFWGAPIIIPVVLHNCIVYFNLAATNANYSSHCTFEFSCAIPLPTGDGNIDGAPGFVDLAAGDFRLLPGSPCIDAGRNLSDFVTTDILGITRPLDGNGDGVAAFDMGAYETAPGVEKCVRYVNLGNPSPAPPYTTWAIAATNIQDAIDAANAGDEVVVTNGVYATGERVVDGAVTCRVAVTKPLAVRSVNGPEVTVIDGRGAVLCAYLDIGCSLSGFMLTNGMRGVHCANRLILVSNCILTGNSAPSGGGASGGTLNDCVIAGNSATSEAGGGGAISSTLNYCTLTGNSAFQGGGASYSMLNNCVLSGNSARYGGGASDSTLNNCTLTANSATGEPGGSGGGGASGSTLNNCNVVGNAALARGGGVFDSTVNNCIVYHNVINSGDQSHANYYYYYDNASINYSCTIPLPGGGVGNITVEPQLASISHLSLSSPCRGAGSISFAGGVDIDGEAWTNPPSMGCDELQAGAITGPLSVAIKATYTNVGTAFAANFSAQISGRTSASRWDLGDGTVVSNQPYASHSWTAAGDYPVVLWAYNESYPSGVSATVTVHVVERVYFVAADGSNPVAPYSSWATAATNIQDAVNAASLVDEFDPAPVVGAVVLVTNGVYQTGEDGGNRVAVTRPLTLRSVNGPGVTFIDGGGSVRCVFLGEGAKLAGFTLTNGVGVDGGGGGVRCATGSEVVSDCVLTGNSATGDGGGASGGALNNCALNGNSASSGGGASGSTLNNCTLIGNSAASYGGGASQCSLNNCTLTGNSAINGSSGSGGGASFCTLDNCTLTGNSATYSGGGAFVGTLNNCTITGNSALQGSGVSGHRMSGPVEINVPAILHNCIVYHNQGENHFNCNFDFSCTTPQPTNGFANITNAPRFLDRTNGNLRLQSDSPCINSGLNLYAPAGLDLDGNPRIAGGTVDVGAYEFQSPQSLISYAWLQEYGLSTDGSADTLDLDGDYFTNLQEWRAGTNPTNALSALRLLTPEPSGPDLVLRWASVSGRNYFLERSTNVSSIGSFMPIARNITGQPDSTTYTDPNVPTSSQRYFYRVGVE